MLWPLMPHHKHPHRSAFSWGKLMGAPFVSHREVEWPSVAQRKHQRQLFGHGFGLLTTSL